MSRLADRRVRRPLRQPLRRGCGRSCPSPSRAGGSSGRSRGWSPGSTSRRASRRHATGPPSPTCRRSPSSRASCRCSSCSRCAPGPSPRFAVLWAQAARRQAGPSRPRGTHRCPGRDGLHGRAVSRRGPPVGRHLRRRRPRAAPARRDRGGLQPRPVSSSASVSPTAGRCCVPSPPRPSQSWPSTGCRRSPWHCSARPLPRSTSGRPAGSSASCSASPSPRSGCGPLVASSPGWSHSPRCGCSTPP